MENVGNELEKGYIMFGSSIGDKVMRMIAWIIILPHLFETNANFFGGYEAEEASVPCHGNFEGEA